MTGPAAIPESVDLSEPARWLVLIHANPDSSETIKTAALIMWRRLVGAGTEDEALEVARAIVARPTSAPLLAYVPPF